MNYSNYVFAAPTILPAIQNLLLEWRFLDNKQGLILDAACGMGALSKLLVENFGIALSRIYGIDLQKEGDFLEKINFLVHDLNYPLPFVDNYFDICFSIEIIEYLENPYLFIREIYRVLDKDGVAIVSTPNISHIFSRVYFLFTGHLLGFRKPDYIESGHIMPIYDPIFRKGVTKAGFKIITVLYTPMRIPKIGWILIKTSWSGQIISFP